MPMVAVFGSLVSGIVSDKFFKGHRSPVAMGLYFGQSVIILIAANWMLRRRAQAGAGNIALAAMMVVVVAVSRSSLTGKGESEMEALIA